MLKKLFAVSKQFIKSFFISKYTLRKKLIELEARTFQLEKNNLDIVKNLLLIANSMQELPNQKPLVKKSISQKKNFTDADKYIANILSHLNGGNKEPTYH